MLILLHRSGPACLESIGKLIKLRKITDGQKAGCFNNMPQRASAACNTASRFLMAASVCSWMFSNYCPSTGDKGIDPR